MADQTLIVDRLQVKRTKVPGRRPAALADGEEFINQTDRFRLIGDGVTPPADLPAYPLRPEIDDVPGLREAIDNAGAQEPPTVVNDADYQCLATDRQVAMEALTASRVISLPDVDSFPFGQDLLIADESGACSDVRLIKVRPGVGTDDTIGGADNDPALSVGVIALSSPYQAVRFRRGATNLWIRL
ncbi:hypothetical protein [Methylorubrum sp. GM97]|uniref:hypothetical protein n=1 Tax=Methylorubrum sp. GM97 TaxID=2938232 RepID=UPI002184E2A7|nr:hypothetical protein [Methylorubrum sp. GM97]BDL41082.1 hypothetical protein MSPGM_36720 [Methylorubrum sp. GM97]